MSAHYAQQGGVRKDMHVFGDVIENTYVLRQVVGKAKNATSSPQVIFSACIDTIFAAGILKVLLGKKMLENGQLRAVSYKKQTSS